MTIDTTNYHDGRPISSGEPSESNCDDNMEHESLAEAEAKDTAGSSRPEPTRGVKKTTSLRRGGAVYAELLQSAVMASIDFREEKSSNSEPVSMQLDDPALLSPGRNKRNRNPEYQEPVPDSRKSTQRHLVASSEPESRTWAEVANLQRY